MPPKPISYFTQTPEEREAANTPSTARPATTELDFAAQELNLAAQGAGSRRSGGVSVLHGNNADPVTPPAQMGKKSPLIPQQNSPFSDPKYIKNRGQLGRKLSAAGRPHAIASVLSSSEAEEFYRSGSPSPAPSMSSSKAAALNNIVRQQTPQSRALTTPALQRFLELGSKEPKRTSDDIGILKPEEQPLFPHGNQIKEIMFQLTSVVEKMANTELVKQYDQAFAVPKNSKYYGKSFDVVVRADALMMLSGVQEVADRIVREIP